MSSKGMHKRLTDADRVTLADLLWDYIMDKQIASKGDISPYWLSHMSYEYYKGMCNSNISLDNAIRRVLNELEKDGATFDMVVDRRLKDIL